MACKHVAAVCTAAVLLAGCATGAFDQGMRLASGGQYEQAVWKYIEILQEEPASKGAREGLELVKKMASAQCYERAMRYLAEDKPYDAAPELMRAMHYDPANVQIQTALTAVQARIGLTIDKPRPPQDIRE